MLSLDDSRRLAMLRFPLIVGVVYIHAYDVTAAGQPTPWLDFVRNLMSQGLARVAVPTFFLMSGYLFFMGAEFSFVRYRAKLRSRLNTLLVPLVLWNLIALAIFGLAQALPATRGYFSGSNAPIASYSPFDYVAAILGIGRPPIAYQFWFLRDLILLVIFSPLLNVLLRTAPRVFLVALGACWFADVWPDAVPSLDAVLFFSLGARASIAGRRIFALDARGPWLLAFYIVVVVCDALTQSQAMNPYLHRVGILLGVGSALYLTSRFARYRDSLVALGASSFFVYAAHEPILTIARKLAIHALRPTQWSAIVLYLALPAVLIAFLVVLYRRIERALPTTTRVLCGGRD